MATHRATLLAAAGVSRFAYKEWSWPRVGAIQIIGDDAKTYLEANRAGWFSYEVADAGATIETPDYAQANRLDPDERKAVRQRLTSDPDVSGPLQIPRVADAAARAALSANDGDMVYQLDTDVAYIYTAGAWKAVQDEDDLRAHMTIGVALGAEVGDVRRATLTVSEAAGQVQVELLNTYLTEADGASQAFDLVTGTADSSDTPGSNVSMLITADAGSIVIDVTDKTTTLTGDMWLRSTPISQPGEPVLTKVTFA